MPLDLAWTLGGFGYSRMRLSLSLNYWYDLIKDAYHKDASKKTLGVALGLSSLTVLDATISSIHCDTYFILVSSGSPSRSMIVQFDAIAVRFKLIY